jgi:hypothetical protein
MLMLTANEAAKLMGSRSRGYVASLCRRGSAGPFPGAVRERDTTGIVWRIPKAEVVAYIRNCKPGPAAGAPRGSVRDLEGWARENAKLSANFHLLNDRQRRVVELRRGIGCERLSLPRIGGLMGGITKQAVSAIEKEAMGILREGKSE